MSAAVAVIGNENRVDTPRTLYLVTRDDTAFENSHRAYVSAGATSCRAETRS